MTTPTAHNNAPANNDPVALVIAMIRDAFTGNFDTLLAHVTDDCIFIGAGANTFRGREDLEQRMGKAPAIPRYTVRDEHFEVVPTDSENDIVVAGSYAIFSDGDTKTISSEIQRITMNLRWNGERWRDYLNFRDYLNAHPGKALQYEACKRRLAAQFPLDRTRYTDGKACFAFLDAIFAKGPEGAICRNRSCWGGIYENDLRYYRDLAEEAKRPKGLLARLGLRR